MAEGESSSEGQQAWEMHLEGITYEAAKQEQASHQWAMHEQHEAAVRAIAERHAQARQREHSRPRFQRSHHSGTVCQTGQRHTYHSAFSARGRGGSEGWQVTKDGMRRSGWQGWWEFFAGFFGG